MKHFTIPELCSSTEATRRGLQNNPTQDIIRNLTALVDNVLDPTRERLGKPIRVNSGYRNPLLNKAVGGAATSQHTRGEAADLTVGTKEGNKQLFEIIKSLGNFDQLIDEDGFSWVHVSYKEGANRGQILKIN